MSEPTAPTIEIAPMTETLHGHIDGISPDGWLDGWAVNLPAPHRPAEIRVLDAGKLVAIGSADNKRLDVKLAGFGNGFCGFSLVLPDEVIDGREHTLSVFARTNADQPEPLGTVVALLLPRQPAPVNERGATAVDFWRVAGRAHL